MIIAVGIPAGYLFDYLDTPIPWMIGPMVGVAALFGFFSWALERSRARKELAKRARDGSRAA